MLRRRSANLCLVCGGAKNVLAIVVVTLIGLLHAPRAEAQYDDFGSPPINYATAEVDDPVARLARRIEAGTDALAYDRRQGYLPAVLKALDIPASSQTLVFSKTSLQQSRISPQRPRAIYFSEDVYIGYCQDGNVLEIAATDARQGATFYTLEQSPSEKPKFVRDQGQCLTCHASHRTQDVPGYLIRSVFPDPSGLPDFGRGTFTTDHTSPLTERWGGWYVTGSHGDMRHMGNVVANDREEELDRDRLANLDSLDEFIETTPYLSPYSDIVALMVLEHQTQMHNAIAWANYETRRAIYQSEIMNAALERPQDFLSESSQRRIDRAADRVLEYLLLRDEFPLTSPIRGSSNFAKDFQALGIRDPKGRSLRELDLGTRMFRYPCSYLIYSDAFDGLPDPVRGLVLKKLKAILTGRESSEDYNHLSRADRATILEILNATKPEFAAL